MKKILAFLMMVISAQMFAQNYPVMSINISLPANPDANTANWGSGASVFIINATAKTGAAGIDKLLIESKILVTIKNGGNKICGSFTGSNAPASHFNTPTKVWSGKAAVSLLGQDCILKPGEYTLCVQFFGLRNDPLSEEKCKSFSIRGEEQQTYQPPQAISPADGSTISAADLNKPVTFRWTPVVPRPKVDVIYKVRLIEILKGQSATAAMKGQRPIYEKDVVGLTQLVLTSLSSYPIAKDSKYGWYVQATNKDGIALGETDGNSVGRMTSSINIYGINDEGIKSDVCDCKGWMNDKLVTIQSGFSQFNTTVLCGGSIQLPGTGVYQITAPNFICTSPAACPTTYHWEVQGMTTGTGTGKPFSFNFSVPGTYTVIITPKCGNQKCDPCIIKIIVPTCDCKGTGWMNSKNVVIQSSGGQSVGNAPCGGSVTLGNPGPYQIIAPPYICNPASCQATYNWTVQGPGGINGTGPGNSFNFNFSAPGTYAVIITPQCGNYTCPPCEIKVIVRGDLCDCKGMGWIKDKPVLFQSPGGQTAGSALCGGSVTLGNPGPYQIIAPPYICNPATCQAIYNWTVQGPGGINGSGPGNSFNFNFSAPGTYAVIITPQCGNYTCPPCEIKVIVRGDLCDCKGMGWIKDKPVLFQSPGGQTAGSALCGGSVTLGNPGPYQIIAPPYICNPASCQAIYTWTVQGPGGINGSGPGNSFNFNFSAPGTYAVIITPQCGNYTCPPCEIKVIVRGDLCDCKGMGWIKDKPVLFQSPGGQTAGSALCGGSVTLGNPGPYQIIAPPYICNPATCQATYNWTVQGPGGINGTGPGNSFNFNFSAPGTYAVIITPQCGNYTCPPCEIKVIVRGDLCDCKGMGWIKDKPVLFQSPGGQTAGSALCGGSVTLGNPGPYQIIAPPYICNPATCQATYNWTVQGPGGINGTGPGNSFNFNFSAPGTYAVIITPQCGNYTCPPCEIKVIVRGDLCDCKGMGWIKDKPVLFQSPGGQTAGSALCGGSVTLGNPGPYQIIAPPYICNPASCQATYTWTVQGPGGINGSGPGNSFNFNFSAPGTYAVIITPQCGNYTCPPCEIKVIVRGDLCDCKGMGWIKDKPVLFQSPGGQTAGSALCGGSVTLGNPGPYQIIAPPYICNPATCQATYNWTVQGPGGINGTGPGNSFNFNFSAPGTYAVIITPQCGNYTCPPCEIKVIVKGPVCECKGWISGKPVVIQSIGNQSIANVICGGSITLGSAGSYQITSPDFVCSPPTTCPTTYKWEVVGPVTGNGTGKPFTFNFSAAGIYTVTITPYCGNQKCEPCKFEVIIKEDLECKCGKWKDISVVIQSIATQASVNVKCGGSITLGNVGSYQIASPDFVCIPTTCAATYKWEVIGPVTGNGTGKPFTFNFSSAGTYTVIITPYCGNQKCEPCKFEVIIK